MRAADAYDELIRRTREESVLASCMELLGWDEDTYMPPAGAEHRAAQMALLAGVLHDRATDPRLADLLAEVESSSLVADPRSAEAANVREIRRAYDRDTRLPRRLVEESARVYSLGEQHWAEARRDDDFASFRPWLERILRLLRQTAEALGYRALPYDALLHDYEPGLTTARVVEVFDALRRDLIPLVNEIVYSRRRPCAGVLRRRYPVPAQREFAQHAAAMLGFDFRRGRLDTTTHPFFCTIGPRDCRLTTRFSEENFSDGFFSTLHETGHGLYEQGLPEEHHGTPAGEVLSLALHESQARLWENAVGRSLPFWEHLFPSVRRAFPGTLADISLGDFHFAVNSVEPTLIRVQADEVTYNLHILIRFELERDLFHGDLAVADLPGAWREAYRHYLGIVPETDRDGCLQDGHWGSGMVGYFPTYTLGNLIAAQLFERAVADLGGLSGEFARGRFDSLLEWLRDRIYRHGARFPAADLVLRASGERLHQKPLIHSLRRKYGELYGL